MFLMASQPLWKIAIKIGKAFWTSKHPEAQVFNSIFEVYHDWAKLEASSLVDHSVGGKLQQFWFPSFLRNQGAGKAP